MNQAFGKRMLAPIKQRQLEARVRQEMERRRLRVRYERRSDIHLAFLQLGCAMITWKAVQRYC